MPKDVTPSQDSNFEITLSLDITHAGGLFSNYALNYHRVSYDQMHKFQKAIADALFALGD